MEVGNYTVGACSLNGAPYLSLRIPRPHLSLLTPHSHLGILEPDTLTLPP